MVSNIFGMNSSNLISAQTWILDTGATYHVCHNFSSFESFDTCVQSSHVMLPTRQQVAILCLGNVRLSSRTTLKRVLHVP